MEDREPGRNGVILTQQPSHSRREQSGELGIELEVRWQEFTLVMDQPDRETMLMKSSDLRCDGGGGAAREAEVTDDKDVERTPG